MAQQWVDITTIDNNTPFSAVRWLGILNIGGDAWFSEASGLTTDGMSWTDGTSEYGWFSAHRMNNNQYSCSFIHTGDTYWNEEGTVYRDHVKDADRNESGFYDTTVEIGGETFYEVDFSLWSGATGYQLYAPYSLTPWSPGEVYVLASSPDIVVNPDSLEFSCYGGSSSVTVTAENDWSASTNDAWITLSALSGQSGDTIISVSTSAYSSGRSGTGVVTFSCNTDTFDLTITQAPPHLDLDKTKLRFKSTGGTDVIEITSDFDWTASTVDNWLTLSPTSGTSATTSVTVTAAAFIGGSSARTDVISITDGINTETVNVKQNYKLGVDGLLIGTEAVEGLYLGTEEVEAMYIGDVEIF